MHNEPISAWECNIYIIYDSWVRKSSCNSRYAKKLDFSYYAQIWKFGPRPPENEFVWKFLIVMERALNFASNEPSTTPDIKFKSSYARKLDFSLLCPNMEIQPQAPKMEFFKKNLFFWKVLQISLPASPQPHPDIKFKSSFVRKRDYAQIWKFSPRLPKMKFFKKKIHFFEKVSRFRFQRALNHPRH